MSIRYKILWIFQIFTFISLVYTLTKSTGYLFAFPFLVSFLSIFLYLKYKELKYEKTYYPLFIYVLSMIPFCHFVLFPNVSILSLYPLQLLVTQLKNIGKGFGVNRELGFILLMFFSYYLMDIYTHFIVENNKKIQIFILISIFAIWAEYKGRGDVFMYALLPMLFMITIILKNTLVVENGWERLRLPSGKDNLSKRWFTYLLPYILTITSVVLIVGLVPLHFEQNVTKIEHIISFQHRHESSNLSVNEENENPNEKTRNEKRVIFVRKYKYEKSSTWLRKIASWKIPVAPIVTILLIEFAIFIVMVTYKILSGTRRWYLLLIMSFVTTVCLVGIVGFIAYKIATQISQGTHSSATAGRLMNWMKALSFNITASGTPTKIVVEGNEGMLTLIALKNLLILSMTLVSVFVMALLIIEGIKNLEMKRPKVAQKKKTEEESKEIDILNEASFKKLISKDPRYAAEILYSYGRSHHFQPYPHLTPYEFLGEIDDMPGLIRRIWKKITDVFVKARYSKRNIYEEEVLKMWEEYKRVMMTYLSGHHGCE